MSATATHRSIWQRVYDQLFKVYGPAQVSSSGSPTTEISEDEKVRTAELAEWDTETAEDGTTYLVHKPPPG